MALPMQSSEKLLAKSSDSSPNLHFKSESVVQNTDAAYILKINAYEKAIERISTTHECSQTVREDLLFFINIRRRLSKLAPNAFLDRLIEQHIL